MSWTRPVAAAVVAAATAALGLTPAAAFGEAVATPTTAPATAECPAGRTPVLVLGTTHFDNPGQDAINVEADDVRSPRRQAELELLLAKLAAFRPTLIAIEAPYRDTKWPDRYAAWRRGERELGRNEIEQIGFRLAARLDLPTVVPVDYPMWMNGWTPAERGDPPRKPEPDHATPPPPAREPSVEGGEVVLAVGRLGLAPVDLEQRTGQPRVGEHLLVVVVPVAAVVQDPVGRADAGGGAIGGGIDGDEADSRFGQATS